MNSKHPPHPLVDYDVGEFAAEACGLCGRAPATIRVRWRDAPLREILPGVQARAGRSETRYFCAEHEAAADAARAELVQRPAEP